MRGGVVVRFKLLEPTETNYYVQIGGYSRIRSREKSSHRPGLRNAYRRCPPMYCAPMTVQRASGGTSLIDALDRVLDRAS
jgi:hypothetical protein